jgi:hypothetical protein
VSGETGTPRAVTIGILSLVCSSLPISHWLSTREYAISPGHQLKLIISYCVILKCVSLGIVPILEAVLSLHLPLSFCGRKASLDTRHVHNFYHFLILS